MEKIRTERAADCAEMKSLVLQLLTIRSDDYEAYENDMLPVLAFRNHRVSGVSGSLWCLELSRAGSGHICFKDTIGRLFLLCSFRSCCPQSGVWVCFVKVDLHLMLVMGRLFVLVMYYLLSISNLNRRIPQFRVSKWLLAHA